MKNLNYLLLGAVGLLMASCSQEEISSPDQGATGQAHFCVKLPEGFSTRSLGDGSAAKQLTVLVYDVVNNSGNTSYTFVFDTEAQFETDNTANVVVDLIAGKSYKIAFFATSSTATSGSTPVYSINNTTGQLTVNYDGMQSAQNLLDAYDCFYGTYTTGTIGAANITANVTLTRPVAQVNWGTTGLNSSNSNYEDIFGQDGQNLVTTLTCTEALNSMNLITGEYGISTSSISLANFASPTDETFPTETGYTYIGMQYLLAPITSSSNFNLVLTISNAGTSGTATFSNAITVSNVPLQANYQTNIYGSLLGSNADLTIVKSVAFAGQNNRALIWDGSATTPEINTEEKTVAINKPSDLAGFAALVNDATNPNSFNDYTVSLAADFDMNNQVFPQIGSAQRSSSKANGNSFQGTFDGQGHTISNVKLAGSTNASDAVGFIGNLDGEKGAFQNVTFSNLQIDGGSSEQVGLVGLVTNGATISNVSVSSGNITAAQAVGAIAGRVLSSGTVKNCNNNASITSSSSNAGGIVGAAYYTTEGTSMTISGCNNTGAVSGQSQGVAGIVGLSAADVSGCTNSAPITATGSTNSVGGIVGQQNYAGSITGCTNTGTVTGGNNNQNYGAGGIVGWIRYSPVNETSYARQNIVSVTKCKNTADVSGYSGVGGIVGMWYNCGVCDYNTNTASKITAQGVFVAGIVGGSQWTETGPTLAGSDGTDMLYVNYNYSTTPLSSMTGGSQALYIYINSAANVNDDNNSQTDPTIVDQN